MAISPPSDIVLDVAKAVDPLQYREAVGKLARLGDTDAAAASFESLFKSADSAAADAQVAASPADPSRANLRDRLVAAPDGAAAAGKPYRQFEAFVLQTFVQSMLPKDATHVYGDGIAGSYWSSMLAEQIANQLADSGGIGIADALARHDPKGASPVASLPGIQTSMELGFADAVRPSADKAGEGRG